MTIHERLSAPQRALALAASLAPLAAQNATPAPAQDKPAAVAQNISTEGLPTFLLPVPAGKVQIGMTIEQLEQSASQALCPARPEFAPVPYTPLTPPTN